MKEDYTGLADSIGEEYELPPRHNHGEVKSLGVDVELERLGGRKRALSASLLQSYDTCSRKGALQYAGAEKLEPTPFTSSVIDSGNEFERKAIDNLPNWLGQICDELGFDMDYTKPIKYSDDRALPMSERVRRLKIFVEKHAKKKSAILTNVTMLLDVNDSEPITGDKNTPYDGEIDLLIWNGEHWVIGDIKCSESGRASYANQITLYYRVWKLIFPNQPILHLGFIAHCSPGHLYNREHTLELKSRALNAICVRRVLYKNFYHSLQNLIDKCREGEGEPTFTPHCCECAFRQHCYSEMIVNNDHTHISLFPASKDEIDSLLNHPTNPCNTIEGLLEDLKSGVIPEALHGTVNQLNLPYIIGRAEAAIRWKGHSCLRWPQGFADNFIVGAWEPSDEEEKRVFYVTAQSPRGTFTVPISEATDEWRRGLYGDDVCPEYFIAYDARTTNYGTYKLRELWPTHDDKRPIVREIALLDLVRDSLHIPFTSFAILEMYLFLREVEKEDCRGALEQWMDRVVKTPDKLCTVFTPEINLKHSEMLSAIIQSLTIINDGCHEMEVAHA